jgi:hypothetical protein
MEIDKIKASNRLNLMRTIDKKRTISSQQNYNNRFEHQRKYTIDYHETKNKTIH